MRKLLATAALVTSTLLLPGVVPEAHAGRHDWFAVGSAFRVGAAHISFVFGRPLHDIGPAYYFRYDRPISYRGHSCNRYCYREAGHYYHHEACPVVSAHFSNYHYDAYAAFSRYAPRYDGYGAHYDGYRSRYRSYGYRDYGHRDRGYRDRGYRDSHRDHSYRDRGHRDRSYRDRDRSYRDRDHGRNRGYRQGYRDGDRHDGRRDRGHNRHNQRQHRHGPNCRH